MNAGPGEPTATRGRRRAQPRTFRGRSLHSGRADRPDPALAGQPGRHRRPLAGTLTEALRAAGIDSDIYYGTCTPDVADLGRPVTQLGRAVEDRWLLYHASIGSPVYDIARAPGTEPKLVNYHNITPAELLEGWAPQVAYEVTLGRAQLERLAPESRFAVADSAFNEVELEAAGYRGTAVVPLLIDMTSTGAPPDPATGRRGWPGPRRPAAPTSCTWARSRRTRPPTTS